MGFTIHSGKVQKTNLEKFIGRKRPVIRIGAMCGDQNIRVAAWSACRHDHRRVLPSDAIKRKLRDVPRLNAIKRNLLRKRTDRRRAPREEIIKILHARPRGCFSICVDIIPSESRRVVHHPCARVDTLRRKIRAVSADALVIIVARVSPIRPKVCIAHRRGAVVWQENKHDLSPFFCQCMRKCRI